MCFRDIFIDNAIICQIHDIAHRDTSSRGVSKFSLLKEQISGTDKEQRSFLDILLKQFMVLHPILSNNRIFFHLQF